MNIPFKPLYDLWKVLNHYNQATIKHKQINNSIKPDANIMVCLQDELVFFLAYLEERNMVGIYTYIKQSTKHSIFYKTADFVCVKNIAYTNVYGDKIAFHEFRESSGLLSECEVNISFI